MTNRSSPNINKQRLEEAADWILAIEENRHVLSSQALVNWLSQSDQHLTAFNITADSWQLSSLLSANENIKLLNLLTQPPANDENDSQLTKSNTLNYLWVASAACMLICFSVFLFIHSQTTPIQRYQTAIGEVNEVNLVDNSQLVIDTNSHVNVLFSESSRQVELVQGRVLASVAHNKLRPFSIQINSTTSFTALGTRYSVSKQASNWTLNVYEGVVGVESSLLASKKVTAGWGLRYQDGRLSQFALASTLTPRQPDWTNKRITFKNTRIGDAIKALQAYEKRKVIVLNNNVLAHKISGVFNVNDMDSFTASIEQLTQAKIIKDNGTIIIE